MVSTSLPDDILRIESPKPLTCVHLCLLLNQFGRGGDTNYHIGNNSFRHLVESYRERYWASSNRKEKSQIIAAILKSWRTQDPPGRFLAKTDPAKGDDSLWHDVGDQVRRTPTRPEFVEP